MAVDDRPTWTIGRATPYHCHGCGTDLLELARGDETRCASAQEAKRILRVVGDENGCVERCPACTSYMDLSVSARKGIKSKNGGATLMGCRLGGDI